MTCAQAVFVGQLGIGGDNPVRVESMLKTPLENLAGCEAELRALEQARCELVRVAFPCQELAESLRELCRRSPMPLMADIHFDPALAVMALRQGCPAVRLNPGNMSQRDLREVVAAAEDQGAALRIGANGGSLNNEQLARAGGDRALALLHAAEEQLAALEKEGFSRIILSAKATSVPETVRANVLLGQRHAAYPLHIGITEAGGDVEGIVRGACGIGLLLAQGLGDTVRVSLTGPSPDEVRVGYALLRALELRAVGAQLLSCPTCGRRRADVSAIAAALRPYLNTFPDGVTIAVMGCEVNGPREARDADVGIAGSPGGVILFRRGEYLGEVPRGTPEDVVRALRQALAGLSQEPCGAGSVGEHGEGGESTDDPS